ncbi:MAG: O-antigen polymerase [Fusobacteriaceae bacterium]
MKLILKNGFSIFLFFNLLMLILSFFENEFIKIPFKILMLGFSFHFFCMFTFIIGYLSLKKRKELKKRKLIINSSFIKIILITEIIGIFCIFYVTTYFTSLQKIINSYVNIDINFLIENRHKSWSEGANGIFKLFASIPLINFLYIKSILYNCEVENNYKKLRKVEVFLFLGLILKSFLVMDRLSLLAILITFLFKIFNQRKVNKKGYLVLVVILIIVEILSRYRLKGYGIFKFLILYLKLGIANLGLIINEGILSYTYGFSTFLNPLQFITRYFGISNFVNLPNYKWVWNPAGFLTSYLYLDFGIGALIVYYFLGFFLKIYEIKKNNLYLSGLYFLLIFTLCTSITVPFIRAIEFWLGLLVSLYYSSILKNYKKGSEEDNVD